jgi:hypothetical protein
MNRKCARHDPVSTSTLDTSAPFWHSLQMNFIVDNSDSDWKVVRYLEVS